MKLKRFMLVTFVLLAILTIGAVSATDATDDSKLSQVVDNFEIVNSPVADEVLADDDNKPEEGSEGSPIDIYDEAYVGDNIVDVRLENGSSGYVKINDDEDNELFNKDLADDGWDSETDEEDDNYVHYRISSSMLAPELSAGEHTLNVFVFNENDEEIASNSKTVNLFDRDVYDENGVHIEIEVLQISLEENNAIVSIKALADATNNVNVVLNGDEDNYEFEKALNEFSTIEDDEDENYKWYFIKPSDFEGIKSGDYFLQLAYTIDENTINRETNIRLVSDDENNCDGDDEGFEFDYWVRHIVSIDDSDRDIVSFNDPGEGTLNITISGNGETHIITCELNSDERVELILEDLEIIEMGVYQISAKYITLSGDESDFEEGQLIVGYAAIVDEFDIRDGDATLVSVYCPSDFNGFILVRAYNTDDEDWDLIKEINHEVVSEDYNSYLNWTLSDFEITEESGENFAFQVYILNEDEEVDDEEGWNRLAEGYPYAYDSTKFRADVPRELNMISTEPVVSVFCPDGSEGTVLVSIYGEDEDENRYFVTNSSKNIADAENNWLYWTLKDLGISEGYYSAMIVVNEDEENSFDGGFEVYSPIIINQEPVYIGTDDVDSIILVEAEIPSDIDDAIIIIKINGTEEFRKSVSDFVKAGMSTTPEDLTWHYLHRYGDEVTDYKVYRITTINIGREFTQGIYNFDVSLVIDEETFSRQDNVAMAEINSVSKDGCTIEIYDASEFYSRDDEMKIIAVYAPEGTSGKVKLTIEEDDEWLWENSFEDGTNIYPCDLGLAAGTYHITVAVYDEDDNQVINNTGVITLNYGEDGFMGSDVRSHMDYDDRWGIRIWFAINDISGRLVIKFDDVTYYDEHVDSSNYDEYDDESGQGYILFSAKQLGINPGNYDVAEISYYGDDGVNDTDIWNEDGIEVMPYAPQIYIRYSDGDSRKAQFPADDKNQFIGVHVNGDDISTVRIVVKIGDETYLDAMLEDLGLELNHDDENDEYYYDIGLSLLNKTFSIGEHYDDVYAYYYSDNYELSTEEAADEGGNPNFFDVIGIADEIDLNDDSDVLYIIGDESKEKIVLYIYDYDNNQDLDSITYYIQEGDDGQFITWKLADLGLDVGNYRIEAVYDDDNWIFDSDFSVVDKSVFYAKMGCDWFFTTDTVLKVWCPDTGLMNITLYRWGEEFYTFEHEITDEEKGGYVEFTLADLNITLPEWYDVNITVDGNQITGDEDGLWVPGPIEMPNTNVYLPEEGFNNDDSMKIAELKLPIDASGNIAITVDGTVSFNKSLDELTPDIDGSVMIYRIYTSDLDSSFTGFHSVEVTFAEFSESRTLDFRERNSKSEDGITIIILNGDTRIDWGDTIAEIIAPNNANGRVVVELNGSEAASWDEIGWIEWDRYDDDNIVYYIHTHHLNIHGDFSSVGKYNIVVTYDDSVSNEGTITFMGNAVEDIWLNDNSDNGRVSLNDHWFVIDDNGHNGRVVLTVNGEVRLNKTLDELDVNDWGSKIITPYNATLEVGQYDDVLIVFYSDEDYSYRAYRMPSGATVTWGYVSIHAWCDEFNVWDQMANINAPKQANGTIVFKIGDKEYFTCALTDINRTSDCDWDSDYIFYNLVLSDFTDDIVGGYYTDVMIYYYGDDGFNTTNMQSHEPRNNVTIWANSKINMEEFEYVYGTTGNVTINVTGSSVAKENVTVDNHSEAVIDIVDGVITVTGLDAGSYTLRITTTPEEYNYETTGTVAFNVTEAESDVVFSNNIEFDYGTSGTTTMTLTEATVDLANISVVDHKEAIITLENNQITVSNLTVGTYTLNVITTPNKNYKSAEKTTTIIVNKIDSPISIDIAKDEFTALDEFVITISNVTAVNVTINDKAYAVKAEGTVDIDTTALDADTYTVVASNAENGVYNANSTSKVFTIVKKASSVKVTVGADYKVGDDFTIIIENNTAASVTINDNAYEIKDGKVVVDTTVLANGTYRVFASIATDGKYSASNDTATFTISKWASEVTVTVDKEQYTAFDVFDIVVMNNTAVTVTINDEVYEVKDGKVVIDTSALDANTYIVKAVIDESEKYLANSSTVTFTIVKKASSVKVTVDANHKVGDDFTIAIENNTAATVTINDKAYEVKDGKVVVDTTKLLAGEYSVVASISEDGKFKANSSTAKFTISKYASQVSISVGESYNVGDDFTIAIVNNTVASVTINGNVYAVKADGTVDVDTTKLAAGEYSVVASIAENDKYLANSSTATFKLSKVETPANDTTIPVDGAAKESKIPTYSINLPNDATGTLTVTIDNKNYTAIVTNGKASVSVPNLPAGNYKVTIAYSGDDKYSPIVKNTTTTVVVDPKVVAKQTSALYTAKYSVTVYGKDDKVAKNTNVVFYINGKKVKTVNTSTNGVATFNIPSNYLPNKKYTIKAVALGKSASKKVTIKQIVTLKTVKFKKSAKKAVVLTATLKKVNGKYQVGKKITFYFKGKKVKTVKTGKKGVAKVTLKKSLYRNLKVGKIVSYKAVYLKTKVVKKAEIKK